MRDLTSADFIIDQLYLGAFPAIDEVIVAVKCHHLAGRMTVKCWYSRIVAKDRNCKHEMVSDWVCNGFSLDYCLGTNAA